MALVAYRGALAKGATVCGEHHGWATLVGSTEWARFDGRVTVWGAEARCRAAIASAQEVGVGVIRSGGRRGREGRVETEREDLVLAAPPARWVRSVAAHRARLERLGGDGGELDAMLHRELAAALRADGDLEVERWCRGVPEWLEALLGDAAAHHAVEAGIALSGAAAERALRRLESRLEESHPTLVAVAPPARRWRWPWRARTR